MSDAQVAVLGGGISGCLTACQLADLGIAVAIVEQQATLMSGASLWSEGKIHLGYTYTGTTSLATAALMQEGAAVFEPVLERVLGVRLPESWYSKPVTYLVDRRSLFDSDTLWDRAQAVASLLARSTERLPHLRRYVRPGPLIERLDVEVAAAETGQGNMTAAWRTTELHVSVREIAERVRQAVRARTITVIRGRVDSVHASDEGWSAALHDGTTVAAPIIVNCLWESRARVDRQVEPSSTPVSIRYRRSIHGCGRTGLDSLAPSTRILGRFGDVTTCANGDAFLSWYPAGLSATSDDGIPPPVPPLDRERFVRETLDGLNLPAALLEAPGATWEIGGGYVVAHGYGDIDRVESPLHERDRVGVRELRPGYLSVDTGKYTLGPLLSTKTVELVRARQRDSAAQPVTG